MVMCFFRRLGQMYAPPAESDPIPPLAGNVLSPNSPYVRVSDHAGIITRDSSMLRFERPKGTPDNIYWWASPGARISVRTNATTLNLRTYSNGLGVGARDYTASVLVNGIEYQTFETGAGGAGIVDTAVTFPTAIIRNVDIVWPYSDGVDLISVSGDIASTFYVPPSRTNEKIVFYGDSITQGFTTSKTTASWVFRLAQSKGRQLINLGFGSRRIIAADASFLLPHSDTETLVFMGGYNNFNDQQPVATFQAAVQGWITSARAACPSAKIYVLSTIYSTTVKAIPIASYRAAVLAAESAVGDANTFYVDGLSLMTNSASRLADSIHPNDLGSEEIAAALTSIIT